MSPRMWVTSPCWCRASRTVPRRGSSPWLKWLVTTSVMSMSGRAARIWANARSTLKWPGKVRRPRWTMRTGAMARGRLASSAVRVVVTGSKGFVGHWMLAHLEEMHDEALGIDTEVDITDRRAVHDALTGWAPDAVCHLAAQASVGASWADQGQTYRVNTLGSLHVIEAALACPARPRVLLISSSEVYGRVGSGDLPLQEDHPLRPVSPYAASKAAAEMIGLQAWLGSGLEVVRVRPFNHTGPGQRTDFVVPALAEQIANAVQTGADRLLTGNLEARRDLTD